MLPIELPILFLTEEAIQMEQLEIQYEDDYYEEKVTFYAISSIRPSNEYDNYSTVVSDGIEYICPIAYEALQNRLAQPIFVINFQ